MIRDKKIFIFGGSGSLGNKLIERYMENNQIINFSRDECKHWEMSVKFRTDKVSHYIGDIRDYKRVEWCLLKENPNLIIIASALKHIDRCEYATHECISTNVNGIQNVLDVVESNKAKLVNLECTCFISTDKACSPINVYGICKALSEKLTIEKAKYNPEMKFLCVRYGNVLNSRGSIIPILHKLGQDPEVKEFKLTHPEMTRFVMTLDQSVDLIEHAILKGESGDIVVPELVSMNVKDMIEIFSEIYDKPIKLIGLRPGEKLLESLINETQSMRLVKGDEYYYIKPPYKNKIYNDNPLDYNSKINPLSKEELKKFLVKELLL